MIELDKIYQGDSLATMKTWPDAFVQTCVTSPPYFGLRDYGHEGQVGQERTPEAFVSKLVEIFSEVKRILRPDGTLWLNLGDSYNNYAGNRGAGNGISKNTHQAMQQKPRGYGLSVKNLKNKDLIGIPWMTAFALRSDGWYLRDEIIWAKPNPMPSSIKDRCTRAHEHIFMFSRSPRYHYDHKAIRTPLKATSIAQNLDAQAGSNRPESKANGAMKAVCFGGTKKSGEGAESYTGRTKTGNTWDPGTDPGATKRSVWTVTTRPFKGAHFATFPADLIEPCVLAGAPRGSIVLDPFMGAGTTGMVAARHGRRYLGCELNPAYVKMADDRITAEILGDL